MAAVLADYIHENLDECPVHELEWLEDFEPGDAVTLEDIDSIIG